MTTIEDKALLFTNAIGIKLWANKLIDITSLVRPHCKQTIPAHKNIETFLNFLYQQYSIGYSVDRGMIIWHEDDRLDQFEELLEKTGNFGSEFLPLPIFLTKDFDFDSYPEYQMKDKGLYLSAFIRAFTDMSETFMFVERLPDFFNILEWYTAFLKRHYQHHYDFFYEMVDQFGSNLLPLTEVRSMND